MGAKAVRSSADVESDIDFGYAFQPFFILLICGD